MLPPNHVLRNELNDEVHARPPDSLRPPLRISYLALLSEPSARQKEWEHVGQLLQHCGRETSERISNHISADLGNFSIRWERHAEFTRYTFAVPGPFADPFMITALNAVPKDWLSGILGQVMVASHGAILDESSGSDNLDAVAAQWFDGNVLVGTRVEDNSATALADFRVRADGFSRFLLIDRNMTAVQAGRIVQRMLEIDTYRMMALLALPVAQALAPLVTEYERELSQVTTILESAGEENEAGLLDRLTRLAAHIERKEAENHYRFGAAAAYYELVQRRIIELRETRIPGLQTFGEFTERRLAPAMNTCRSIAGRQESLSQRVARANQLLATRVDLTRESQNHAVLESMNRRAQAQFKLQQTVEGLSIVAITYYFVGLIGYLAKGIRAFGWNMNYELAMALSIPVVAGLATFGIRHLRHTVTHTAE